MAVKQYAYDEDRKRAKQRASSPIRQDIKRVTPQQSGLLLQRARVAPSSLAPEDVLQLQSAIGNRAVSRLLAKLTLHKEQSPNRTGLPDQLKAGIESLSGFSMDDVRVHYNSPKPAQLNALAYTQGTEIHVASGQAQHLPHEAWHVVQQMQGGLSPTFQLKGEKINDDKGSEYEADMMGKKALQMRDSDQLVKRQITHAAVLESGQRKPTAVSGVSAAFISAPEENCLLKLLSSRPLEYLKSGRVPSTTQSPIVQRQITDNGKVLSTDELRRILRSMLDKEKKLSKSNKEAKLANLIEWAARLDEEKISADLLTLYNSASYEMLLEQCRREARLEDEQLGEGAHARALHVAITKSEMEARIGGKIEAATKFVDPQKAQNFIDNLKSKAVNLRSCLEALGDRLCEKYVAEDLTNQQIKDTVQEHFGSGCREGGIYWSIRGTPTITHQQGGQITLSISWKAVTIDKYRKIKVTGVGHSESVTEPITIYAGDNTVDLIANPRQHLPSRTSGLEGDLLFQTVF